MPNRCIAACCSNVPDTSSTNSVKLYRFPKDPQLCQRWTMQVQRTRAGWSGPTKYSTLCSEHFTDECFDPSVRMRKSLGFFTTYRNLTNDAVPTIFKIKEETLHPHDKLQAVNYGSSYAATISLGIRARKQIVGSHLDASGGSEADRKLADTPVDTFSDEEPLKTRRLSPAQSAYSDMVDITCVKIEECTPEEKKQGCRRKEQLKVKLKAIMTKIEKKDSVQNISVKKEDTKQNEKKHRCRRKYKLKGKVKANHTRRAKQSSVKRIHEIQKNAISSKECKPQKEITQICITREKVKVKPNMPDKQKQTRRDQWRVEKKQNRMKKTLVVDHQAPPAIPSSLHRHREVNSKKRNQFIKHNIKQGLRSMKCEEQLPENALQPECLLYENTPVLGEITLAASEPDVIVKVESEPGVSVKVQCENRCYVETRQWVVDEDGVLKAVKTEPTEDGNTDATY